MADEVDVENVLVGLVASALYPNGTSQPSAASPAPPGGVQVFRGWPSTQSQEKAKIQNFVNVSVAARNGVERNTSRYPFTWQTVTPPIHTLTVSVNNSVITLGGTVSVPQNVFVLVGQFAVFNYAVQANDTLSTIASALANLIKAKFPNASSNGATITVPTGGTIQARVASSGTVLKEVGRQEKSFQISIWAPPSNVSGQDPDAWRTSVAKVIDPALKSLVRIVMPDQVYAHIKYERTITMDAAQMEGLYRRDLYFFVEYATTVTMTGYEIGAFQDQLTAGISPTGTLPLPSDAQTITTNS